MRLEHVAEQVVRVVLLEAELRVFPDAVRDVDERGCQAVDLGGHSGVGVHTVKLLRVLEHDLADLFGRSEPFERLRIARQRNDLVDDHR